MHCIVDIMGAKLRAAEVAELLGVSETTFRAYVSKQFAPQSVGRDPQTGVLLWDRDEIRQWHENRPGRGRWRASRPRDASAAHPAKAPVRTEDQP